ncbi:MAG: DNA repair protein RecO [Gemmatimonadota bacterium]|nr:DNA repair protein RecO [Gemmatimonadota bacterium]
MAIVTTDAILLRAHPFSESSRVLKLYTRDLGLVGVMARGIRRGASRGHGGVDTFGEGTAVIFMRDGRELQSLREFSPLKARFALATDFRRLAGASIAAEIVLRHAAEAPNPELYRALSVGLDQLGRAGPEDIIAEVLALGWRIIHALGFAPELTVCTGCGRALERDEMARFDLSAGGVRGPECPAAGGSRRIGPIARAQLLNLLEGDVPEELRGPAPHLTLLDDFLTFHMLGGRRLASFDFLDPSPPGRIDDSGNGR